MTVLSDQQLNSLNKAALVIVVSSLQDQLASVREQLDSANSLLADSNRRIEALTEQIRIMNQRQFGHKSESNLMDGQLSLFDVFNEVEATASKDIPEPEITEVTVSEHTRKKKTPGKRETDLEGLPARIIDHKLSNEELNKLFPKGYKELPVEIYKRLHIIPETFMVDEHHIHVYASKNNDGTIIKAPHPADLFRNSIATPPLVASIIHGKYVNALPLDRQSRTFRCNGVNLATNTMANWVIRSSEDYLSLLYDRLHKLIYNNHVIHADETPVQVMRINGRKIEKGQETRMWVYRNSPLKSDKPTVLFDWKPSRSSEHPREFLKGFSGVVVTDGYEAYHKLGRERPDLRISGCWIHARRPFAEFIKSLKDPAAANGTVAAEAYAKITEILHIDNGFDDLSTEDRLKQRQLVLQKKVDDYFTWVKLKYSQVAHQSTIGKALFYSINQEPYLRGFLTDGDVPPDNNYAEQAIRPFTIGRKNFVLIESSNGANASAVIYSIVETAKANNLNVYKYLELLLSEIPQHMADTNLDFINDLLPWAPSIQEKCHNPIRKS